MVEHRNSRQKIALVALAALVWSGSPLIAGEVVEVTLPEARQWCSMSEPLSAETLQSREVQQLELNKAIQAIGSAAAKAGLSSIGIPAVKDFKTTQDNRIQILVCAQVDTDDPPPGVSLQERVQPSQAVYALVCANGDIEICGNDLVSRLQKEPWNLAADSEAIARPSFLSGVGAVLASDAATAVSALTNAAELMVDIAADAVVVMPAPRPAMPATVVAVPAPGNP